MEEKRSKQKERNSEPRGSRWKWAFLTLSAIVLGSMIWLFIQLAVPSSNEQKQLEQGISNETGKAISFQVAAEKEQVNLLIDQYITEKTIGQSVSYQFQLTNQAELAGTFEVFGIDIPFHLDLDPFVMENGNIQLKAKQIALGQLNLPIPFAMKLISQQLDLPHWVAVNSEKKTITLRLNEFSLKSGVFFSADRIDLAEDDIRLTVFVPKQKISEREEI
ncbi:MAG: YpmS family protein [Pisciglobus halotolerans]|nr:YpmS family protein [Pisciglobus halotolerans]